MPLTLEDLARGYGEARGRGTLKSCIVACIAAGYDKASCTSYCRCLKRARDKDLCRRHLKGR
ncbi:MAG: hypothetical protein F7B17_00300 [Desulfurococcales archaeon]|nr:hypothetical protein [Desulfurococcales archaeon]